MSEPAPREGDVAPALREELPGLGIVSLALPAPPLGRSPREVRNRLDALAARVRGADVLALRGQPIPHAYRVLYRHIGLDPDVTRVPIEAAMVDRLMQGGFPSRGLLDDALTIALIETGVPLWALDADTVDGALALRLAQPGEPLGRGAEAPTLPAGRIVVADARGALAPLFGDPAPGHGATRRTTRLLLFAVRAGGVPAMHVDEALWLCAELLDAS